MNLELYHNLHSSACLHGKIVQILVRFQIRPVQCKRSLIFREQVLIPFHILRNFTTKAGNLLFVNITTQPGF